MAIKPTLPRGVRDFLPEEVLKREYLFDLLKSVFKLYGYVPIETPSFEALDTLTGKYGDEGDRLLYKILNNGDYLAKANKEAYEDGKISEFTKSISKRGLRYDLTVPLARYVVMNQNDLYFPFKRYQIQPVWRADRAQRGRYNEFFQCDADVVGSHSLLYEAELFQLFDEAFRRLGLPVKIRYNHRKILQGLTEKMGLSQNDTRLTTLIDKLDKIGLEKLIDQARDIGLGGSQINILSEYLGANTLDQIGKILDNSSASKGIEELKTIQSYLPPGDFHNALVFDPTLARGLDYYTGCVIEIADDEDSIGSLGAGGRYSDLTGLFGKSDLPGVGISFGAERIFLLMQERNLFPEDLMSSINILLAYESQDGQRIALEILAQLRSLNISAVIYPEVTKLKKQLKYGEHLKCELVIVIGQKEIEEGTVTIKNIKLGSQQTVNREALFDALGA